MAGVFAVIALVPRWRQSWQWGRSADGRPISRAGFAGIIVAFLLLASGPLLAYFTQAKSSLLLALAGFLVFVGAGIVDSLRAR